jgi:formamidopyrimidine-DNA glycosylase
MPELPEVQTVVNTLNHTQLINTKIINVKVYKPKLLKNSSPTRFRQFLLNEKITRIERLAKYLIFKLSNRKILVVHLRMEGKLFYESLLSSLPAKHCHIEFYLANKHVLRYYDSRIFGTFHIYKANEYLNAPHIKKIALDPLDTHFDGQYLHKMLTNVKRPIKTALLDQTKVSGIGNIYADEILFLAKIHPLSLASNLELHHYEAITKHAKYILKQAIKYGGTTIATYQSANNHIGQYQNKLLVHSRKGLPCKICHTSIQKIRVNGRGTYFCSHCQKKY